MNEFLHNALVNIFIEQLNFTNRPFQDDESEHFSQVVTVKFV